MPYVVVAVETSGWWPSEDTIVEFVGRSLTLRPGSQTRFPTVFIQYEPDTREAQIEAFTLVRRFLSSLAWADELPVRDVMTGGGGFPIFLGRAEVTLSNAPAGVSGWRREYLPEVSDPKARRALALFREALGLEEVSKPYAFLGYAKILNIGIPDWRHQLSWMNEAVTKLRDHFALQRLTDLRETEADLGLYLYTSGRCAVAHANAEPTVDPDDVGDTIRLAQDLPVAKALAEHVIEAELGVKTRSTIYREHPYELEGFHPLFGQAIVTALKKSEVLDEHALRAIRFPLLTIRLDDGGRAIEDAVFANLRLMEVGAGSGALLLHLATKDAKLHIALTLHFGREQLVFDPEQQVRIVDDGSVECVDYAITRIRFLAGMVSNGRTEAINAETGERLGRTDPCLPVNIDPRGTIEKVDSALAKLQAERSRRAETPHPGTDSSPRR